MPNWSTNYIAIKDKKEKVLMFVNSGLINSGEEPEDDIESAVNKLNSVAVHKISVLPEGSDYDAKKDVVIKKGLTLRTFLPMPDTFLEYDTTNYADKFKDIAEMQKEKYGNVGWYDYNINTLGTKWDSDIENFKITGTDGDIVTLEFSCETAWSMPTAWLTTMKNRFDVHIFILANEESSAYNVIAEVCGEVYEDIDCFCDTEGCPQRKDYPDGDDGRAEYDDAICEFLCDAMRSQEERFQDIVHEYVV